MAKIKPRDLFESVGVTAVVLSLIFVGLQIRQDQNLARADLGSRALETLIDLELTVSDPAFAKSYEKMIHNPNDLTNDEMIQLNSLLRATVSLFVRECYLKDMAVYVECDQMVRAQAPYFFGSEYAQAWWRENWQPNPYTPEWMNQIILNVDAEAQKVMLEEIKDGS